MHPSRAFVSMVLLLAGPTHAAPAGGTKFRATPTSIPLPTFGADSSAPQNPPEVSHPNAFLIPMELSSNIRVHVSMPLPDDDVLKEMLWFGGSVKRCLTEINETRSEIEKEDFELHGRTTPFAPLDPRVFAPEESESMTVDFGEIPFAPEFENAGTLLEAYSRRRQELLAKIEEINTKIYILYLGFREILRSQGVSVRAEGIEELKPEDFDAEEDVIAPTSDDIFEDSSSSTTGRLSEYFAQLREDVLSASSEIPSDSSLLSDPEIGIDSSLEGWETPILEDPQSLDDFEFV